MGLLTNNDIDLIEVPSFHPHKVRRDKGQPIIREFVSTVPTSTNSAFIEQRVQELNEDVLHGGRVLGIGILILVGIVVFSS
jgi:hypothetical protein